MHTNHDLVLKISNVQGTNTSTINIMYTTSHLFFGFQGGGQNSDDEEVANPFRFTVCIFLPKEIITVPKKIKVVEVAS